MTILSKLAIGVAAAGIMAASTASATVFIGLQEAGVAGGAITTVATDPTDANFTGSYGTFTHVDVNGDQGVSPVLLFSNASSKVTTSTAGTLLIWVTETGLTAPTGVPTFTSGFTENLLTTGWSVTQETGVDPNNGLFNGFTLGSAGFTAIGTSTHTGPFNVGAGPYSVTELFIVTANGAGQSQSTIQLSAVPEPASWAMMLVGFGLVGAVMRRRPAKASAAA
jgi:hypothetical protein